MSEEDKGAGDLSELYNNNVVTSDKEEIYGV